MNHYETLGVSTNATQEEIKEAYKALVKKYHPDIYAGDKTFAEKKIKEINNAYDVLSDYTEKLKYDAQINVHKTTTSYTYTPPTYNYTPPKYDFSSSKYSYENYKKTYKTSSYEYEKRYTDFHRSKRPNSNYTSASSKVNEFHDNITNNVANKFNGLQTGDKVLVFLFVVMIYLFLFILTCIQTVSIIGAEHSSSNLKTNTSVSQENSETSTDYDRFSREDFDINDYYTDAQLREMYLKGYYTSFETFSEFKEYFEDFVYEYTYGD